MDFSISYWVAGAGRNEVKEAPEFSDVSLSGA